MANKFKQMQASLSRLEERNRSFPPHQTSNLAQHSQHFQSSGTHRNFQPNQRQNSDHSYNRPNQNQRSIFKPGTWTTSGVSICHTCGKRGHISPVNLFLLKISGYIGFI